MEHCIALIRDFRLVSLGLLLFSTQAVFSNNSQMEAMRIESEKMASKIKDLRNKKSDLIKKTTEGYFMSDRRHVLSADDESVKKIQNEIVLGAREIGLLLQKHLSYFRLNEKQLLIENRLNLEATAEKNWLLDIYLNERRVHLDFNSFLIEADSIHLVYRSDNYLGRYGTSQKLLDKNNFEVAMTPFDWTVGFAHLCASSYGDGLVVYKNTITGEIAWLKSRKSGIAIVSFNSNGTANYVDSWKSGFSSAYNLKTNQWVRFEGGWKTPTASVYNPNTERVEVREGGWRTGIGGVYNPKRNQIEWKTSYCSGIAGYYDENDETVKWVESWKSGVACIWRDSEGNYLTSNSFFGGVLDDDD